MFFSQTLALSYATKHYIVIENIFAVIDYCLLILEILDRHLNDCFKIDGKQMIENG